MHGKENSVHYYNVLFLFQNYVLNDFKISYNSLLSTAGFIEKKKVFMDIIFILIIKHATVVEIEYKLICIQPMCFQLRSLHQCLKKKYTYQLLPEQQESFFVQSSVVQPFRLLFSNGNEGPRTKQ